MEKDVTSEVEYDVTGIDGGLLPITKCVCGMDTWKDYKVFSGFLASAYEPERLKPFQTCPKCGAKLFFVLDVKIIQMEDDA